MPLCVLITRPEAEAKELAAALGKRGMASVCAPMLEICDEKEFRAAFDMACVTHAFQALLVTSRNAVRALEELSARYSSTVIARSEATKQSRAADSGLPRRPCGPPRNDGGPRGLPEHVFQLPVYAVGAATTVALHEAGFAGAECGGDNALALIAHIRERCDPAAGPLLYVSGREVRTDLAAALTPAGFTIVRLIAYDARPVTVLPEEAAGALREGRITHALFYSVRTAETFAALVQEAGLETAAGRITALAISGEVADVLRGLPWQGVLVAKSPDHAAMLQALGAI